MLLIQRFIKEALVWKRLSHPNVLPFLGVVNSPQGSFGMVSSWMPQGNIVEYLVSHPTANRPLLVRNPLTPAVTLLIPVDLRNPVRLGLFA